jgi:hypothetical protein
METLDTGEHLRIKQLPNSSACTIHHTFAFNPQQR